MALCIFYNADDAQQIEDSYRAARNRLTTVDRLNLDACWGAGLSAWNTTATHVYINGVWNAACYRNGILDTGLCDEDTRLIVIDGVWARDAPAYGAVRNEPIMKAQFVQLVARFGALDTDPARGTYIISLSRDIADTAREPWP